MRKKFLLMMVVTTVLAVSAAACTPSAPGEGPPSELAAGFALAALQLLLALIAAGQTGASFCITLICGPV